jgi:hypothetical protein
MVLAVAAFLHATRALRVPAFAFPWLQLVADRRLMPKLLGAPASKGWAAYLQLLLAQLRFLEPFLRNAELTDAVRLLYKGTLRVLLVLLHDFPDFLCHFHFHLCDAIPPSCIQVRGAVCVWGAAWRMCVPPWWLPARCPGTTLTPKCPPTNTSCPRCATWCCRRSRPRSPARWCGPS